MFRLLLRHQMIHVQSGGPCRSTSAAQIQLLETSQTPVLAAKAPTNWSSDPPAAHARHCLHLQRRRLLRSVERPNVVERHVERRGALGVQLRLWELLRMHVQ